MKKLSIFAVSTPKTNNIIPCDSYFYGYNLTHPSANIKGLSIHNGLLQECFSLSLARCGEAASSLLYILKFFINMPKTMKDVSKANNSSLINTDSHETALLLISELNKLASSLPAKLTVNIHIINIVGNNNIANSGVCVDMVNKCPPDDGKC